MDKLAEIVDIQTLSDEAMNSLLALSLEYLSGLRTCLFEEARALSLTDPNDGWSTGKALHCALNLLPLLKTS